MALLIENLFDQSVEFLNQQNVFYGHGVELAEDEVVLLFMHVFNVDFVALNQMSKDHASESMQDKVQVLLRKRVAEKIPMAYLVGFSVFAGLTFKIDQRALIPRSPFVELIDKGFEPWVDISSTASVMDLCTGSGCIGLAIAHYFEQVHVDLVDLSADALVLAQENTDALNLNHRVLSVQSDLFVDIHQRYDLIVANPPYVAEDEYRDLPDEFTHEPKMALVSRYQGMEIPVKILFQAAEHLNENGCLFLEVGYNDEVLSSILPAVKFEWVDFSLGGQGICVFNRADLLTYRAEFKEFLDTHVA